MSLCDDDDDAVCDDDEPAVAVYKQAYVSLSLACHWLLCVRASSFNCIFKQKNRCGIILTLYIALRLYADSLPENNSGYILRVGHTKFEYPTHRERFNLRETLHIYTKWIKSLIKK